MSITPLSPEEVRAFREARGWSQKQAADEMGVSKRAWENWETRKVYPETPDKGAPPPYMRLAFAAIEAGLSPWARAAGTLPDSEPEPQPSKAPKAAGKPVVKPASESPKPKAQKEKEAVATGGPKGRLVGFTPSGEPIYR